MLELLGAGGGGSDLGGMRQALFSLLDPLVAGRPLGVVLEAGVSAVCHPKDLEHRYDWKLRSLAPGSDLTSLPFQNASFDAVLALDASMHPAGTEQALGELARVLARGGMLVLGALSGGQHFWRKSLIKIAERQCIRVLRSSRIHPASSWFPCMAQALWLRAGLDLPVGRSIILIGEKTE
jgi:SAM-dependent methyltransferase